MKMNLSRKEKTTGRREYIKLLEEHFELTIGYKNLYLDERLCQVEQSVLAYRERFAVTHPKIAVISVLFVGLVASLLMGMTWIWVINVIIRFPVDYSVKNILAISSVSLLNKAKLNFFNG